MCFSFVFLWAQSCILHVNIFSFACLILVDYEVTLLLMCCSTSYVRRQRIVYMEQVMVDIVCKESMHDVKELL